MATFNLTVTGLTETTTLMINATPAENGSDFLTDTVADTATDFMVEFTDPNGDATYNGNLSVALHDDNVGEATGTIKLTLNADPDSADTYELGSITEGLITIFDNETPELKISGGSSVVEAENATADFVITAGVSPNTNLTVRYDLAESHDFINNEGMGKTEMLDFTSNKTSATLPITIHNDGGGEPDGTITVTLVADTSPIEYLVAPSPNNSAQVTVYDDDTPTIFIAADSGNFAENAGPANFKLSATGLTSTRTLIINATPAEDGSDFLTDAVAMATDFMVEFTDPDGDNTYSGELAVTFHDDDDSEETGDIKLTLNPDNSATYRLGSTREGVITVYDDETPELQITAGEPVAEAPNAVANFLISVVAVPDNSLNVRYELAESQNFIANEGTNKMVTLEFTDDAKELTLPITITSDTDVEDNGSITVTLTPDNANPITYRVAPSPDNSAQVNVIDDDSLPRISVTADNGDVAENTETALFSLTTTDLSAPTTLTINATPIEDGHDFLASTVESIAIDYSVLFTDLDGDGTYSGQFPVTLDNDNTGEATGDIKLTLNTKPTEYRLSSAIEGAITIWDDDAPELEISGGDPVIEADNVFANFVISAEVSPNENVEIRYDLIESHSFITNEGTNKTGMLDFTNGATEATLPIAITNDIDLERNGSITVTLTADTADPITYTVAAEPNNSASISVFDDDSLPIISIDADSGEVIENEGPAQFILTATGLSATTTLAINATPAEDGGDFLATSIANNAADFSVEFSDPDGDNTYSGELSVVIENDRIGEATGDIKLTLNTKPIVYRLSSATEGVLTIFDDDAPELQITAGNPITETTNVSANFMISAEVSPNKMINLRYNLLESHNFIDNEGNGKTASLNFSNNVKEVMLPIPITNDNTQEDNGFVQIALVADDSNPITYTVPVHPNNLGAVTIYDDDSPPTITVIADNGDAIESSGSAGFELTATGLTATTTLLINATPVESGSNFLTTGASGTATNYSVEFTDPDGDNTYDGELSVPLVNDSVGEGPGDITLTVNASPIVYRLNLNTVSVITMWDDDAPQLKVTAGESVTEGVNGSVDFHISTPVSPNKFINVRYNLVDSFNSITDEGLGKITRLDFTNGKKMATLSFTLVDDSHVGIDGAVSLTLIADNANPITYLVAPSPDNSGIIHVQDDDTLPWVSVASNSRNIEAIEGQVNVNLSSEGLNQTTTLTLNATLTETGSNFLLNGTSNVAKDYEIEFSDPDGDNTYSGVFPVPIVSDAITEVSGNILLTFNADPRSVDSYRLRPANQSRIRIYDDDAPELAISAMGSVTEAENVTADFVVTAKVSPYDYLTVRYNLSETHNFIENEGRDKSARLDFTSGKTEATLSIPVVSDTSIEQNGSVIVLLIADTADPITYTVAPSPNHFASVIVT